MISLEKARKLLGKTGEQMSDEEVIALQRSMRAFVDIILDTVIEDIKSGKKKQRV